jgi:serine/threonine-protein kinase
MEQLGKYEILERIGEGGFGTVWKGRDPFLKRTVAIKTCTSDNEELRKRFLREAEIAGGLHHPNVTLVHDFGYHDQVPYLVQEFLTGEDLSSIIRRRDAVPQTTKLAWLTDVARGLEFAHSKGVVHRDVKPANVRIIDGGLAKVMDFGIAKLAEMNTNQLTKTGTAMGTIGYMAPEQVNGQPVDHRADIFAYGVMAYELLTFERPFEAETMSRVFYRILHEDPKPISDLIPLFPADLERVVLRCLAKDPHHRYGNFRAVLADLEKIAAGEPLENVEPGDPTAVFGSGAGNQPTAMLDSTGRPTAPHPLRARTPATGIPVGTRGVATPPPSSTTYAAPSPSRLPKMIAIAAGLGVVVAGSAILLMREKPAPPAESPALSAPLPAVVPAPTVAPESPQAAPAVAGPTAADRARAADRLDEARRLQRQGRREAALAAALDAVAADPDLDAARSLVEELARGGQTPAQVAVAAPTASSASAPAYRPAEPAPVTVAPAPTQVPSQPAYVAPAPTAYAAPAPVQPTPAPVVDRAAADETAIRRTLGQYESADERLDAGAVAAVWTGLGAQRQAQLEQAFANYKSLDVELTGCSIRIDGDVATADCRQRQTFELKIGKATPRDAAIRFKLRRGGDGWRIDDVGN